MVDGRVSFNIREICPKDFYWFAVVENDYKHLSDASRSLLVFQMLLGVEEEELHKIPHNCVAPALWWMNENLLKERVMRLQDWLQTAFHLQKQRWDDSIDWLEQQPMSKVLLMIDIQSKFGEEQERKMKQANKRKR